LNEPDADGPVRAHGDGAVIAVRAVPGASVAKVVGRHGSELRVRVCSPPVDGRANEELCEVLAATLGLRPRDVHVLKGHSSRSKQVAVALSMDETRRRLLPWIGLSGASER
jgi:uncharacterized protein (TIGR00251 family)